MMAPKKERTIDLYLAAEEAEDFIARICTDLFTTDDPSVKALRIQSIFRGLRRHLPLTESLELLLLLPMGLRGIYLEGWDLYEDIQPLITVDDFLAEVLRGGVEVSGFEDAAQVTRCTGMVLDGLCGYNQNGHPGTLDVLPAGVRNLHGALTRKSERDRSQRFQRPMAFSLH